MQKNLVPQVVKLSHRSVLGMLRQPQSWAPGLFFPLLLAAVYASQFSKAVTIAGFPFPDVSFLDFVLPACVIQGVLFGSTNSASDLAADIENSFMDRLLVSPVARGSILLSRLTSAFMYGVAQAGVLICIFLLFGANIAGGAASIISIVVIAALLSVSMGSFGIAVALRTGSQEVVQSTFPLIFVAVFVSSAFFPVQLMEGWYGAIARKNPLTWVIDPTRRMAIEGFSWGDLGQSLGIIIAIGSIGIAISIRQLRKRLVRAQ
ncbi:MAG: hypothetical protein CL470_07530 [Acidimicrobiaceae bacterium]|nr:hypothetical protein [Acidimicrobiaceae bacterium]